MNCSTSATSKVEPQYSQAILALVGLYSMGAEHDGHLYWISLTIRPLLIRGRI
ncbi:PAS domain protein [Schaalia cardiffensis F0333]|uniref:PAS domain protein n=1 Tax=Schaalia cardiffensis F0333 TaxID=888050 RepID=N6X3P8_9ACTO|nr:PAS domain protein [Schaalia cardiffensis F0333]